MVLGVQSKPDDLTALGGKETMPSRIGAFWSSALGFLPTTDRLNGLCETAPVLARKAAVFSIRMNSQTGMAQGGYSLEHGRYESASSRGAGCTLITSQRCQPERRVLEGLQKQVLLLGHLNPPGPTDVEKGL
ncbi:hypothetical protein DV515_00007843 [Chloebia gouldiae]|uniref:Uncharacterized protein n=1 Tax=Chloebia gouldiae TaxID=44316 RepID=A0A3L8SGI0_CHLGU|nr:hypothetical protein DV515_00007843 [Chloebia gouldiae]